MTEAETNEPAKPKRGRRRQLAGVILLVVPAAYLASAGPALYGVNRRWVSGEVVNAVYKPVTLAGGGDNGPWFRVVADYVNWWAVLGRKHFLEARSRKP